VNSPTITPSESPSKVFYDITLVTDYVKTYTGYSNAVSQSFALSGSPYYCKSMVYTCI
jgi:hypothetical protein